MHEEDGDTVQRMPLRKSTRFRITASVEPVLVTPDSDALDVDSGENSGCHGGAQDGGARCGGAG
jgi:hypothetical protein